MERFEKQRIYAFPILTLVNGMQDAGYKSVSFDASGLSSGMYVHRITAGAFSDEKKMMLVK
jgi:hypothetical protein